MFEIAYMIMELARRQNDTSYKSRQRAAKLIQEHQETKSHSLAEKIIQLKAKPCGTLVIKTGG